MAIRQVNLAPEPRRLQLSAPEWRRRIEQTGLQALTAITAGQGDALREIFASLAGWDEQRAYQARRELAELALNSTTGLAEADWTSVYLIVCEAMLDALEQTPAEPVLLNYAGVFLYELTEAGAAEALFSVAARLEPQLDNVHDNLKAARRRARSGNGPKLLGKTGAKANALGLRGRKIATQAGPTAGLTLSLVMIVKNEEEMLPGCLAAISGAVDEMVIVDTGSTDRTVEIAESFGAKVVTFPWNGSFADARNVSLDNAKGDWVLYLDADEHLVPEDAALLRPLLGRTWREGFYLSETNYTGGEESGSSVVHLALRLFRRRPEYRFEGRIHEQKTKAMPMYLPERFETTPIRMLHYGYLKSRVSAREKAARNIELLEQERRDAPSPFIDFNLGSEYIGLGAFDQARQLLDAAWAGLRSEQGWSTKGYAPMCAARLVQARREAGDPQAARAGIDEALAHFPEHTELVLQGALCARDEGNLDEAARLAERCLEMGDAPARYAAAVGAGTYLARCLLAETRVAQGRKVDAEEQYRLTLTDHPGYIAPVLPLATLMLARGATPAEVRAELETDTASAMLLVGSALYEAGHSADAETEFRGVLARQPENGVARIGLVETLLARRHYAEAASEAALEPVDSPVAALAAAAALFAYAAAVDVAGLTSALAGAGDRGVAAHVLELYSAWRSALAGDPLPAALPTAAAPTLFTALEALLRVLDFDAFGKLHPLAGLLQIDPREGREALAQMYLRRGFLDSAAEEWLAVAEVGPDTRAYVGLAQVALARGLREDAQAFAGAALQTDPSSVAANRLVKALASAQ